MADLGILGLYLATSLALVWAIVGIAVLILHIWEACTGDK